MFIRYQDIEMVLGTGHSFVSGADSSMLYKSLKADDQSGKYVKHEGRITSAGNFAGAVTGIVAGFLAAMSLRTPFYFRFEGRFYRRKEFLYIIFLLAFSMVFLGIAILCEGILFLFISYIVRVLNTPIFNGFARIANADQ